MQIHINGRGAFLGAFAAIALAALTAAQLPSLQARSAGGGYMGLMNPGRELWRFTAQEQISSGAGYTVPAGKELIICGVARQGYPYNDGLSGSWDLRQGLAHLVVNGETLLSTHINTSSTVSLFPGLLLAEGDVLEFGRHRDLPFGEPSSINDTGRALVYGYLRDI